MTNPKDIMQAYLRVAACNHYLVGVVGDFTQDELDEAEQMLITMSNDEGNKDPVTELALDLLEEAAKIKRLAG